MFQMKQLVVDGIFSHLCVSDGQNASDQAYTRAQAECFQQIVQHLEEKGYACGKKHLLASYGIFSYPEYAWDYARVGVALYGTLSNDADTKTIGKELLPVFSMKARVASVRNLKTGETAGRKTEPDRRYYHWLCRWTAALPVKWCWPGVGSRKKSADCRANLYGSGAG